MHTLSNTALLGLAMLSAASSVAAVSLSSFTPRLNSLPPSCQAVYTTTIDSCKPEDFSSGARCSAACVQGLVKITEAVLRGCATVDVGETSIIGVFQNGIGIQALCPGVQVTTISSSTATTTRTSAQIRTSASTTSTSTSTSTTRETTTSVSRATDSVASSTGAIATDPSVTSINNAPPTNVVPPPPPPPNKSSAAASATQRGNSQLSNANSGGGSPFDVVATGSSAQIDISHATVATFLASTFLLAAFA